MDTYHRILELLPSLNPSEQAELQHLLRSKTSFSLDDLVSVKANDGIICPECGNAETVVKNGKRNGVQRYACKACGKSFTALAESFLARSHKNFQTWKRYIHCMMDGYSLRKSTEKCGISLPTAFYWRHKLLDILRLRLRATKLKGIVEADDTFFRISYKGSTPPDREAYKRGTPSSKRGLSKDKLCVTCAIDRNGKVYSKPAAKGRANALALRRVLGKRILSEAVLCTDKDSAYRKFARKTGLELIQLEKNEQKGVYSIQHINSYHSRLKSFMVKFKGVASKYLENYLSWMNFIQERKVTLLYMLKSLVKIKFDECWHDVADKPALPLPAG